VEFFLNAIIGVGKTASNTLTGAKISGSGPLRAVGSTGWKPEGEKGPGPRRQREENLTTASR